MAIGRRRVPLLGARVEVGRLVREVEGEPEPYPCPFPATPASDSVLNTSPADCCRSVSRSQAIDSTVYALAVGRIFLPTPSQQPDECTFHFFRALNVFEES